MVVKEDNRGRALPLAHSAKTIDRARWGTYRPPQRLYRIAKEYTDSIRDSNLIYRTQLHRD